MIKIAEYTNFDLYNKLLLLEPPWYKGESKIPMEEHYQKVYKLLEEYKIYFKFSIMHMCKGKKRIELWKTKNTEYRQGKKILLKRVDEYISIYEKGGTVEKSKQVDPESAYRTKQEVINNMEEW